MNNDNGAKGGLAFPWDGVGEHGMFLRDYFAAAALHAVIYARTVERLDTNQESIAEECYELADALLQARTADPEAS